jgi:sensor c-di-GMP phosphodiesterase-like protein
MTRTLKQHVLFTLTAVILIAAVGTVCGYVLGIAMALRLTEGALQQYALHMNDLFETYSHESHAVLAKMNASPHLDCSEAEVAYFRSLLLGSEYMRDAGQLRNGKIECSALMGRLDRPLDVSLPNDSMPSDSGGYRNFALPQAGNLKGIAVQSGNSFVVFNNFILAHLGSTPMHYSTTVPDVPSGRISQLRGESPNVDRQLLTRDGIFFRNGSLFVTLCSTSYSNCGTAYISIPEALWADRDQVGIYTAFGGLVGALFGLSFSIFYLRSLGMERHLRRAIRKDQLRIVYQPIVQLASGLIVGAEALARWTDDDGFAVNPEVFVRLAEERGFVGELTELVVRHTLRDFAETLRSHPGFHLSINVTASDLADVKFLPMLERSIDKAAVAAQSLAIEVTESSTASKQVAQETIHRLRQRGHSVHIDDFGTGYSSLAYLHYLSVDAIKIDRTFTQAIGTKAVTVGILPQILALAKALDLQVIAEGIETVEQAAYFAGSEMPILGQGWLFGYPVPAEDFHRQLDEAKQRSLVGRDR